jgi:hemerythrin
MARQVAAIRAGTPSEEALRAEEQARAGATQPLLAALHGLLEQVAERNKTLRALNTTLEQRVTERTRELTQLVESLKQQKAESQRLSDELAEANKHLELMAMTDALTGLPNRRHAIARMERAWRESTERGTSMAVMMVDVDKFKLINDTFGHDAGDHVLVTLSKELAHAVRTDDIVCRMGGDEFLIVCPHTPSAGAKTIAESVWSRIHALRIAVGDHEWRGSISVGVAVRGPEMPSIASLIKAADEAVYAAKEGGRDRIVVAAAPAPRG